MPSMQAARGAGRTTHQIRNAPRDTVYIAPDHATVRHCLDLAFELGRSDVKVFAPAVLERGAKPVRAYRRRGFSVVVDHAAKLTEEQKQGLESLGAKGVPL